MKKRISILLIVITVLAVYAPVWRDGFVWDDYALVLRDPLIRSWRLIPEGFQHFLFTDAGASDFYRPIQRLTYTVEYVAFAFRPAPFHFTNVAIHAAAAVALFFLLSALLALFGARENLRRGIALTSTIVWALHPVQSAAVIYIAGRGDPLAALFGFGGLWCAMLALDRGRKKLWVWNIGAGLAFLLSALSKEAGLIFPLLWLALILLQKNWQALRRAAVISMFMTAIYLSLRFGAEHVPPPKPQTNIPLLVRPVLVARAFAEYAGLLAFPLDLHMDRDVETHPTGFNDASIAAASKRELQNLVGLALIGLSIFYLVRTRRRDPAQFTLLLLAVICYLPVSGIFLLNATVAEHWLYLPSAFLFPAIAIAFTHFSENKTRPRIFIRALNGLLLCWIIFLGARTFVRCFDWKDQRTFLQHTLTHGGDSARMLINLAALEMNSGQLDAAKNHYQDALRKEPGQPLAVLGLAGIAIKQNDFKLAHELLDRAVKIPAVEAQAQENLAVLESKEKGTANIMRMRLASRTGSPDWSIEKRYIKVLDETGYTDRAIAELQHVLQTQWYRAESWHLLSQLLAKYGKPSESAEALAEAKRYDAHLDLSAPP